MARTPTIKATVEEAMRRLVMAAHGHHRGAKPSDVVIAAAAESAGITVLHYHDDYDRIASVTNQPTEWVAPKGSLPH